MLSVTYKHFMQTFLYNNIINVFKKISVGIFSAGLYKLIFV